MFGLSLEEIALYEIVGEPVCLSHVVIVPAFYELIPIPEKNVMPFGLGPKFHICLIFILQLVLVGVMSY